MQHLRPHEMAARQSRNAPPPRPIGRLRFRDQGGWLRAAIVLIVAFFVAFFAWPAIQNEVSGRGGWFDTPPFRQPDYRIPEPPPWVNDRPYVDPPPSSGRGNGWREVRPDQGGRRW